jgi:hypothetical protein
MMNKVRRSGAWLLALSLLLLLGGCQTTKPYDYTNFRAHPPRSILVLPPLNESTTLEGTYSYLSTVSRPLAEHGYYVFPVAVVDQFLKDNGLPTTGEMNQVLPGKVGEITGADAVMYLDLRQYGSKFVVINSVTTVEVFAKLIDTRTGILLWDGRGFAQQSGTGSGNLLADLLAAAISQAINRAADAAHSVSRMANNTLFLPQRTGLPYGPYSPKYDPSH